MGLRGKTECRWRLHLAQAKGTILRFIYWNGMAWLGWRAWFCLFSLLNHLADSYRSKYMAFFDREVFLLVSPRMWPPSWYQINLFVSISLHLCVCVWMVQWANTWSYNLLGANYIHMLLGNYQFLLYTLIYLNSYEHPFRSEIIV